MTWINKKGKMPEDEQVCVIICKEDENLVVAVFENDDNQRLFKGLSSECGLCGCDEWTMQEISGWLLLPEIP